MLKLIASLSIVLVAMAVIYAIADPFATTTNTSVTTAEVSRHTSIAEFGSALKRAAIDYRTARAKCELLSGLEKTVCTAEAKSEQKRAKAAARANYKDGVKSPTNALVNELKTARPADAAFDVVLYRAHRQLYDSASACFATGDADFNFQKQKTWPHLAMN